MRLYHRTNNNFLRSIIISIILVVIWGCSSPQVTQGLINTNITADSKDIQVKIPSGSTVQEAIKIAHITLGEKDRVEPPSYVVLSEGDQVKVIRVREEYFIEQEVIPFEHQEIRNEVLPDGERRLSQPGVNGLKEITYHRIFEDEVEVSTNIVKTVILQEAIPEVIMIGSRSSFTSIEVPGKIAYLSGGNAWIIENSTSNRRLVVSTGDLDGRIFTLSSDGKFLLYSRFLNSKNSINRLWLASVEKDPVKIIDLDINDVIHFAEFNHDATILAYSTVEWRETAPGWQANNDLFEARISTSGYVASTKLIVEPNSGGVYGWWGMDFSWAPDEMSFLYSRPDGIGVVDERDGSITSIYNIVPYQTGGNWAWVPGASWSPDGKVIYTVDHILTEANESDNSQQFDLVAIPLIEGSSVHLISNVGMFAYPVPSPVQHISNYISTQSGTNLDQDSFAVGYLQAIFPNKSETSGYRLSVIDRDGSNQKILFPDEGAVGLNPQRIVWSPEPVTKEGDYSIAVVYNGNVWLINSDSGVAQQITGDGLTTKVDWR